MSLSDEIQKAEKEITTKQAEIERMKKLVEAYPDVRKHVGRWEKVAYCSKSVNSKVVLYDLRHNCGCCNDSPLEVWPYLETPFGKVYSDPPMFFVGKRDPMTYGDRPNAGWRAALQAAGLPEGLVSAVGSHFKRCRDEARAYADGLCDEDADGSSDEDDEP